MEGNMFELSNEEGLYQKSITTCLREHNKKFYEFFRLSVIKNDFVLGLIKCLQRIFYNRNMYHVTHRCSYVTLSYYLFISKISYLF
jgi:hypothetical protein